MLASKSYRLPLRSDDTPSHGRIYVGERFTTIRRGELGKGLLAAMLRQLDIDQRDF